MSYSQGMSWLGKYEGLKYKMQAHVMEIINE